MEKHAEKLYGKLLNLTTQLVGKTTTYQNDLLRAGQRVLGSAFAGVFAADNIPRLNDLKRYAILNLDKSNEAGSHWIAVAHKDGKTFVYDSFGRATAQILPELSRSGNGKTIDAEYDAEQHPKELNCGARALAWLLLFEMSGEKVALLI